MARTRKDNVGKKACAEIEFSVKLREPIINENGETVYLMPIVIKNRADLENYHIGWKDCKTLYFGKCKGDTVYFYQTTDKALADFHWSEVNTQHSADYRKNRCKIPGTLKPLITCPDTNKCSNCPYPEYRDKHQPDNLSWELMAEEGYEVPGENHEMRRFKARMEINDVCKVISQKNPKYTMAIVLKEYCGYSVPEIAKKLNDTERNIYFYLNQAKAIGKKYKEDTENDD